MYSLNNEIAYLNEKKKIRWFKWSFWFFLTLTIIFIFTLVIFISVEANGYSNSLLIIPTSDNGVVQGLSMTTLFCLITTIILYIQYRKMKKKFFPRGKYGKQKFK